MDVLGSLFAASIGGLVGGVYGAVAAKPAEKVAEDETVLRQALNKLGMQETMRNHVLEEARNKTNYSFVVLLDEGPTSRGEGNSYRALESKGIDSVLEISMMFLELNGKEAVNPPLALSVTVEVRIIAVPHDFVVYHVPFSYKSQSRFYNEWAMNDAQPIREELDRAYQNLAEQIVDELFLVSPLSPS